MIRKEKLHQVVIGAAIYISIAITALVYWPGLKGDLMLDDFANLRPLGQLDDPHTSLKDVLFGNDSGLLHRPISMLSFAANHILNGDTVWSYKYTNLIIHLLCGLLIYWLTARLLAHTSLAAKRWGLALFTMVLWLVSPMWVSTTLYVVQRMAQLSAMFSLGGLLCYVVGRERLDRQRGVGILLLALCFLILLPLALLSKENGALLPLLALTIELFFFQFKGTPVTRRIILTIFAISVALPAMAALIFVLIKPGYLAHAYALRDFTFKERILTEPRILFSYVHSILLPGGPNLGLYHDDFPVSTSLFSPPTTLLAILGWIALLILPFITRNKSARWAAFGVFFFLAGHALESTIIPLELYFEHRNYLPGFGIFFGLTVLAGLALHHVKKGHIAFIVLALFPATYTFATYQRVQTWSSYDTIILSDATRHPESVRLNTELATYYANHRQLEPALAHLKKAETINPNAWSGVAMQRIALYCIDKKPIPSEAYSALLRNRAIDNSPYTTTALEVIRGLVEHQACPQLDNQVFFDALQEWIDDPSYRLSTFSRWKVLLELGQLQFLANQPREAVQTLKKSLEVMPNKIEVGLLAIRYQITSNDFDGAAEMLKVVAARNDGSRNDVTRGIEAYSALLNQIKNTKAEPFAAPFAAQVKP